MVIDYVVEFPCEPRRRLGREGLLERFRRVDRAGAGPVSEEQAAQAREAVFELRPLAFHCAQCPANHADREFGCMGAVHAPISREAERWLISHLPTVLKGEQRDDEVPGRTARLRELLRRLHNMGVLSAAPDESARPAGLFEGRKPAARSYGSLLRRERVDSSQLLRLLLLRERVEPAIGELVCRTLGVWADETGEDGFPEAVFTEPVEEDDDRSVAEIKALLLCLMVASSLDAVVCTHVRIENGTASPEPSRD
jgi:hypothetical protein